ncbi:beta/alpha barrel domain-containing protein [Streptomyces mirabilis]|uniref:hypothetical protein n=1 Tax=Streptomyces mirabilis TaxID=68239 RepID=UPI00369A6DB7
MGRAGVVGAGQTDALEVGRVGVRISPGSTVNGVREDDTEALYPALLARLKDLDLACLRLVHADPDTTVYRRIRADWPGVLIGNPVLTDLTTEALMYVGGADGYTDYPALDAQAPSPSRDSIVATDGPRVA